MTLTQIRLTECGPGSEVDEVVTEVLDPFNRRVEHTHSAPTATSFHFKTTVTFTPQLPGAYHVTARFEPSAGTTQVDAFIAVDRVSAPTKTLALGVQCHALEVMRNGLALCLTVQNQLQVFRDEVLVQTLDAEEFATAGDVVWIVFNDVLHRRVAGSGTSALGPSVSHDAVVGGPWTLFAREDMAAVVGSSTVLMRFQGGALTPDGPNAHGKNGTPTVVYPREDLSAVLLVRTQSNGISTCVVPLSGGTQQCRPPASGATYGSDSTGIWSRLGNDGFRHQTFEADGGVATTTLALAQLPTSGGGSHHFESTPHFGATGRTIVPRFGPEGITFEAYEVPPGFTVTFSSSRTVRAQHADGRQLLIGR